VVEVLVCGLAAVDVATSAESDVEALTSAATVAFSFLLSHAATMVLLAPLLFRWRDCSGFRPSPEVDLDKGGLSW